MLWHLDSHNEIQLRKDNTLNTSLYSQENAEFIIIWVERPKMASLCTSNTKIEGHNLA